MPISSSSDGKNERVPLVSLKHDSAHRRTLALRKLPKVTFCLIIVKYVDKNSCKIVLNSSLHKLTFRIVIQYFVFKSRLPTLQFAYVNH